MIKVTRKDYEIVLEGHACYAEPGQDIVCAAASMLFYALVGALEARRIDVNADDGSEVKHVSAQPPKEFTFDTDVILDTICTGYKLLADEYPENVTFEDIS